MARQVDLHEAKCRLTCTPESAEGAEVATGSEESVQEEYGAGAVSPQGMGEHERGLARCITRVTVFFALLKRPDGRYV